MRAVNLLPGGEARRTRSAPQPAVLAGAIAGVVVVAFVGGGNLIQTSRVSSAQKALNSAKLQLAGTPLPPQLPQVTPPPAAVAQQMQPRLTAVTSALSSRIAWDRILREFSLVMPPDVQVSSITLTQPAASTQSAQGLQLSGMTFSYDGVARLLSRMALIPDLTGVTLSSTSFSQNVVSFTINAAVKGAAVPATPTAPTTPEPGSTTTTTSGTPS